MTGPGGGPRSNGGLRARARGIILYATSRTGIEILFGLRGFALASILGAESFGIWALFQVCRRYATHAGLGTYQALEREAVAADLPDRAHQTLIARTALGFSLAVFGVLSAIAAILLGLLPAGPTATVLAGLATCMLAVRVWGYAAIYLRIAHGLRSFAVREFAVTALSTVLVVGFAWLWGIQGAFLGVAAAAGTGILLAAGKVPLRPALSLPRVRNLVRIGLPISLSWLLMTSLGTADRIILGAIGGIEQLGYYAFGVSLAAFGASLGHVVRMVVFQDVYKGARLDGMASAVGAHLRSTLTPFVWLLSPLLALMALTLDPLVSLILPAFEEAVPAARIFMFTGVAAAIIDLANVGVVAADRQRVMPVITGAALVLSIVLSASVLLAGLGLEGLAAAALLTRTLYAAALVHVVAVASGAARPWALIARSTLPHIWCATAVALLGHFGPEEGIAGLLLSAGLLLLMLLPLAPWGWSALGGLRSGGQVAQPTEPGQAARTQTPPATSR